MRLPADLRRALPYDVVMITQENYAIAREVYHTNPAYFEYFDKVADDDSILSAISAVPEGFDIEDKLFAAFCEDGMAVAVVDLLAGYPTAADLWIGLILVHGDFRRTGIGAGIVSGILQAARAAGFDAIHLGVIKANEGVQRFWEKIGFVYERESGDYLVFKRSVHESI